MLAFAPLGFPLPEFIMLVLGFGFLIFVHELGHFAVAKWVGIRCPQFAIGFGKAMFSWRKGIGLVRGSTESEYEKRCIDKLKADGVEPAELVPAEGDNQDEASAKKRYSAIQVYGAGDELGLAETEYRLNYLPLGGYVKMMGQEDMDPNAKSDHPNAYNNKPIWARSCVISAGVVMNMIFGAIFLAIAFSIGVEFPAATVGPVQQGMPAATTYAEGHDGDLKYLGLQEGDVILAVNGKEPEDFKDVAIAVALGSSESVVELVVERRGLDKPLTFKLKPERQKTGEKLLSAGFQAGPGLAVGSFEGVDGDFASWYQGQIETIPAAQRERDQSILITKVNGQAIETYAQYLTAFDQSGGKPVDVTFKDLANGQPEKTFSISALPTLVRYPDQPANLLGMVPAGEITFVAEDTPAEEAGMQVGDILKQVGPVDWPKDTLAIAELLFKDPKAEHQVVVLRDGETIDLGKVKPNSEGKFGVVVSPALDTSIIAGVLEDTPAAALEGTDGFMPGTQITRINGAVINDWAGMQRMLMSLSSGSEESRDNAVRLTIALPIEGAALEEVDLPLTDDDYADLAAAGWTPDHSQYFPVTETVLLKANGIGDALGIGMDKTGDFVVQTYITLARLIQGDVKLYNLRGPVGIVSTGTQVAQQGFPYLLFFLGLISVNLAVINFLPIPIVDGGHMVFLLWEKISGKPPSEKVQAASLYAGLAIIGFVFIATFYFDVMRELSRFF